jgi:tetratricopeptide (TPR) repeat protein
MASILDELKRRKIVRVVVVYAATGFVVLQAADLILPRRGVPEWASSLIVVLLLLGFPVALVLGWALELTPDGLRVTGAAAQDDRTPAPALLGRRTIAVTSLLVVLGLGLGAGWVLRPARTSPNGPIGGHTETEPAMAVLPFTQMPGNIAAQNRLAIELLREALALDPRFELAWSRLAWRYQWQTWHGDPTGPEKALEYSGIALELNPRSAEAHRARAAAYSAMRRNVEALGAFRRALEIDPHLLGALADGGWSAALLGEQAEGLRLSAGAMRTAANVPNQRYHVGIPLLLMDDDARLTAWLDLAAAGGIDHHRLDILRIGLKLRQGRHQEALEWLREAVARAGGHEEFEGFAAEVRLFAGDLDSARPTIEHLFRTNPDQPALGVIDRTPRFSLALLLARQGERVRVQELLDDAMRVQLALVNAGATAFDPPLEIAAIHALKGDRDASLDWLERAFDAGFRAHRLLRQDAAFDSLRGDERFEHLLGRMAELNARERARVEAAAMAAGIDAMIAAGPARREGS